jgi:hypothetical protein
MHMAECSLLHILGLNISTYDPRYQKVYKLFYSKLPISVEEYDEKVLLTLFLMGEKFQLTVGSMGKDYLYLS